MKKAIKKVAVWVLVLAMLVSQAVVFPAVTSVAQSMPQYASSSVREGDIEPELLEEIVWMNAAVSTDWNTGWNSQTTRYGYEDGIAYVQANKTLDTTSLFTVSTGTVKTVDISDMQYLEFDIWLPSDTYMSSATNGSLELTSSGKSDSCEINFSVAKLKALGLTAGWNHVKLDLDSASSGSTDAIDLTKVNYMRLFIFSGKNTDMYSLKYGSFRFTKYSSKDLYDPTVSGYWVNSQGTASVENGVITASYSSPTATEFGIKITDSNYYKDMSDMEYLEFDLYLSSTDIINNAHAGWGVSVELRSNGSTIDDYETAWVTSQILCMHLMEGWNHLKLSLAGAEGGSTNAFDISQVSWFRMYTTQYQTALSGDYEMKFKNIRLTKDVEDPYLVSELMLNACGSGSGLKGGTPQNRFHYASGDATYNTDNATFYYVLPAAVDIRGYQFVEFDMFVNNADTLFSGDSSFELTSSGKSDNAERSVPKAVLASLGIKNGWNKIKLSLNDFTGTNGTIDLTAVNYFRFYTTKYSGGKMLDNVRLTRYDYQDKSNSTSILLDKGDSLDINSSYGCSISLDTSEAESALVLTAAGTTAGMLFNRWASYKFRYDFTNIRYIEFDLYTENINIFKKAADCRMDLTSGSGFSFDGTAVHVTSATFKALDLNYGWNHIKVPIDYSTATDTFNIKDVRGFRLYTLGMSEGESIKLKNFYATGESGTDTPYLTDKPDSITYNTEYAIANGDSIYDLSFGTKQTVPNTASNGEHFMQTTVPGGYNKGTYTINKNVGLTIENAVKDDLVLTMLFYIDDVKAYKKYGGAQIEISSDPSNIDNNDLVWNIHELPLKSGWNRLNLSFSDGNTSNGTFDPSSIALFRMYLSCYTDTVIALDDIMITTVAEVGEENLTEVSLVPSEYWIKDIETPEYEYTFVAVPDLQEITQRYVKTLNGMFNYIADTAEYMNTRFVMGLGDLTWSHTDSEFENARAAYGILDAAGIEYSNVYGNHDLIESTQDTTTYNTHFDYSYYAENFSTFAGAYEEGSMDNTYYKFDVNGVKYLVLAIEYIMGENADLMEWANGVVAANPDYNVIVTTHAYLEADATYIAGKGDYLWENLVRKHSNIFAVICGHVINDPDEGSHARKTAVGDNGNTVYEFMFNSQDADTYYNGLGMLMFMHFSDGGRTITFRYYSPLYDAYFKEVNQFSITLDESSFTEPATDVASVNGVGYASLAKAVANANAGDTVTLLCDAAGEGMVIDKDITIDFSGYTYTVTTPVGSACTVSNGLQLLEGNNITLKNGTLKVADDAAAEFYILVQNYANLTVTDMTLDGTNLDKWSLTDGDSYVLSNNSGAVEVNGNTTIIANDDGALAYAFDVCRFKDYDAPAVNIDITGTIYGNVEISESIAGNLTVKNGTFVNSNISDVAVIAENSGLKLTDGICTVASDALIADIDGSGTVDAADISNIRIRLLGLSSDEGYYDINGDGTFDIADLIRIKKLSAS